ncbi:MAG: hypothetical protein ACTHLW_21125 [Verrucomicrobiota bacterium]
MARQNKGASQSAAVPTGDWDEGEAQSPVNANANTSPESKAALATAPEPARDEDVNSAPKVDQHVQERKLPEFPKDYIKCFGLLAEVKSAPAKNRAEAVYKRAFIEALKNHIHRLQLGLPVVEIDADAIATSQAGHGAALKQSRLRELAKQNPDVRSLLESHASLKAENEQLKGSASGRK